MRVEAEHARRGSLGWARRQAEMLEDADDDGSLFDLGDDLSAVFAAHTGKAMGEDSAAEIGGEGLLNEARQVQSGVRGMVAGMRNAWAFVGPSGCFDSRAPRRTRRFPLWPTAILVLSGESIGAFSS